MISTRRLTLARYGILDALISSHRGFTLNSEVPGSWTSAAVNSVTDDPDTTFISTDKDCIYRAWYVLEQQICFTKAALVKKN